jgi:tripeptidyl-peptidase-1
MSLGSLSWQSCNMLCTKASANSNGAFSFADCYAYMQTQRQVCMFLTDVEVQRANVAFQAIGMRGISAFGATGDGGSHFSFQPFPELNEIGAALNQVSCAYSIPTFPASSPFVVGVGGSSWIGASPAAPIAWPGSGSGFSWEFPMPEHQKKAVQAYIANTPGMPASSSYNTSGNAYPTVSALAINVFMCEGGNCFGAGGTSASTPLLAGMFTMLNDLRLAAGKPTLGFVAPRIFQVAVQHPGVAFKDITQGNSKGVCATGFPATQGFDAVTGFGDPIWPGLVKHFGQ